MCCYGEQYALLAERLHTVLQEARGARAAANRGVVGRECASAGGKWPTRSSGTCQSCQREASASGEARGNAHDAAAAPAPGLPL